MFQRLGAPTPSSRSKWTRPGWMRSSSHRPSGCRFDRTTSTASAIRGSGSAPDAAEVVERPQHVVVPVVREREARGTPGSTTSPVLLRRNRLRSSRYSSPPRRASLHRGGPAGRPLELEQPVEHVDRRVERGPHRPVLGLAVPAAVVEPLAEDPLDDRGDVDPEVGAGLDRPAVDARLDLAVEVPLPGVLPAAVLGDERRSLAGRTPTPGRARGAAGSAACASSPSTVARVRRRCRPPGSRRRPSHSPSAILEREEAGAPALVLDPRPLGRDLVGRRVRRDRAAPASGWRGRPRAATRSRSSRHGIPARPRRASW